MLALLAAPNELASESSETSSELLSRLARARIQGLAPEIRKSLEYAAAFGPYFWDDGLRSLGLEQITEHLEQLAALGIIETRDTSRYPMTRKRSFRTEVLWQAARNRDTERSIGRRIAAWLRAQSMVSPEMVASHFMKAEAWHEASAQWLEASRSAIGAYDARSAESLSRAGLETQESTSTAIDLSEVRLKALDVLGEFREMEDILDSLDDKELAPSHRLTQRARRARLAERTGELAHALRLYKEVLSAFEEAERFDDGAEAALGLEAVLQERGDTAQAVVFAEQAYKFAKRVENARLEIRSLLALGRIAYATADVGQALRLFDQAKSRARESDQRAIEGHALRLSGAALSMAGASEKAQQELILAERRLASIPDEVGVLEVRILLASVEGDFDLAEQIDSLAALHHEAETCGCPTPRLLSGSILARLQLDAGLEVEAAAVADALLTLAQKKAPRFLVSLESTVGLAEARLGAPSGRKRVEAALRRMELQKSSENEEPFRIYARHAEVLELVGEHELAERQWKRTLQILREVTSRVPEPLRAGFARRSIVRAINERVSRRPL